MKWIKVLIWNSKTDYEKMMQPFFKICEGTMTLWGNSKVFSDTFCFCLYELKRVTTLLEAIEKRGHDPILLDKCKSKQRTTKLEEQ